MRLFILLSLFSFNIFAEDFSTFETYKNNSQLLTQDIERLQALTQANNSPEHTELLKSMNTFKQYSEHLSHAVSLQAFVVDAKENRWANLVKLSQALITPCESEKSKNIEVCKQYIERMKAYVAGSNLTPINKEKVITFIEDYILQIDAFATITPEFITTFNKNAEALNLKLKQGTAVSAPTPDSSPSVSIPVIPKPKKFIARQAPEIDEMPATEFLSRTEIYYIIFGFLILLASGLISYFGYNFYRKKKIVKSFYSRLFALADENNVNLRVFGSITSRDVRIVEKVQEPFLNVVYLSKTVSHEAQIRFKTREQSLGIEVNYTTSRSIQNIISLQKENSLKESIDTLQGVVEELGGKFTLTNQFNSQGKLVQSSLFFSLPK